MEVEQLALTAFHPQPDAKTVNADLLKMNYLTALSVFKIR